jgi:hypothetical protein
LLTPLDGGGYVRRGRLGLCEEALTRKQIIYSLLTVFLIRLIF